MASRHGRPTRARAPRATWVARMLAVLAAFSLAAACSGGSGGSSSSGPTSTAKSRESEGEPQPGGRLTFAVQAETDGWDPMLNTWGIWSHFVGSSVFDPLARVDEHGDAVPFLAESIDPNDDYTVWTIKVRPGVTFHNGEPLDAQAVADNIDKRRTAALNAFIMTPVDEVVVVDPATVEVHMNQPWVAFDYLLTQQTGYMMAPSTIGSPDAATHPIGTGPFVFEEWTTDDRFLATRNDEYWQEGKPYLDEIEFRPISDPDARSAALESGVVDAIQTTDANAILRFRDSGFEMIEDTVSEEAYVFMNTAVAPFDNKTAREALVRATDRARAGEDLFRGLVPDATGPFTEGERWYDDDGGYPDFDLAKAKQLVQQYEEETGKPLSFTYTSVSDTGSLQIAQLLQQMWKEAGMEVEIESIEQAQFIVDLIGGDIQASYLSNFGYADPDFFYVFLHSANTKPIGELSINFSRTEDEEIDMALDAGRTNADPAAREQAYADLVSAINDELPYAWLFHQLWAIVAKPQVNGLTVAESVGFGRVDSKPWLADVWIG